MPEGLFTNPYLITGTCGLILFALIGIVCAAVFHGKRRKLEREINAAYDDRS